MCGKPACYRCSHLLGVVIIMRDIFGTPGGLFFYFPPSQPMLRDVCCCFPRSSTNAKLTPQTCRHSSSQKTHIHLTRAWLERCDAERQCPLTSPPMSMSLGTSICGALFSPIFPYLRLLSPEASSLSSPRHYHPQRRPDMVIVCTGVVWLHACLWDVFQRTYVGCQASPADA